MIRSLSFRGFPGVFDQTSGAYEMSAGKGDRPRPVDKATYDANYDRIKWSRKDDAKKGDAKSASASGR